MAARFDGALDEVRDAQGRLADKLRKMTDAETPRAEALRALEASLGKVAAQLHEAETRSRAGFVEAREDMTGVQRRLERLEAGAAGRRRTEDVDRRQAGRADRGGREPHQRRRPRPGSLLRRARRPPRPPGERDCARR